MENTKGTWMIVDPEGNVRDIEVVERVPKLGRLYGDYVVISQRLLDKIVSGGLSPTGYLLLSTVIKRLPKSSPILHISQEFYLGTYRERVSRGSHWKALKELIEIGLLHQYDVHVYLVNPDLCFRGSYRKSKELFTYYLERRKTDELPYE